MSINDTTKPPVIPGVLSGDGVPVDGADGLLLGESTTGLTPAQIRQRRDQQAALNAIFQREKESASKDFMALLMALFLGEKEKIETQAEDSGNEPLSENSSFLTAFSSRLGIDREQLQTRMRQVRAGKMDAHTAAQSTYRAATETKLPSAVDLKGAEQVVAKYAAKGHPILELLASKESGGNYNITFGGKMMPLTTMTVDQVLAWQEQQRKNGAPSTAAGKYQIIYKTLAGLKSEFSAKGENIGNQLFDERMQERLGMSLLEGAGLKAFKENKINEREFMTRVSRVWAAAPKDMGGNSYYAGDGLNKAHINPAILLVAMRTAKDGGYQSEIQAKFAQGGVKQPASSVGNPSVPFNKGGTDEVAKAAKENPALQASLAIAKAGAAAATDPHKKPTTTT